jgi:hypothetical protein
MATKHVRAVGQDERAEVKAPVSLVVAAGMSERDLLVALRTRLAGEIDKGVPPHALKGIASELRDVDRSIRAIDLAASEEEESVVAPLEAHAWDGTGY